ncbi:hypothetical protein [Mesorhizobium sp. B2-3-15]|uniref:hypothetical protein n=1 Tax=Mesorhizobium sp. B2-3-15 TaxID=2589949 RepID=UPI00112D2592|nr:hypothetical protein [Mesorhizobium sp. B2-3-15]TPL71604.1 hypothetical protein FJ954_18700 [Mesorhizobium sp. B2-3-15]
MRMILTGIIVTVVVAFGAGYVLQAQQVPSWQVFSTDSARVGDPGHNLVGQNWSGDPAAGKS